MTGDTVGRTKENRSERHCLGRMIQVSKWAEETCWKMFQRKYPKIKIAIDRWEKKINKSGSEKWDGELSQKHEVAEWKGRMRDSCLNTERPARNPKPGMSCGEVEHSNTNKTWYSPQDSKGCLLNKVGMGMLARGHNCFPPSPCQGPRNSRCSRAVEGIAEESCYKCDHIWVPEGRWEGKGMSRNT